MSVFDLLTAHPFSADLPNTWLHQLATAGQPAFHSSGTRLFREGAVADAFWLTHTGVTVIDLHVPGRGDIALERVGPGAVVGWSWSRPPYQWRFGAVVAEDVRGVKFDAFRIRRLMIQDPELGRELGARLLQTVADRLEAARHRLAELYAYPPA